MNDYKTMFSRIESDIKRHDDIDLLYTLVEKATPMKPTKRMNYMVTCPSCQDFLVDYRAVDKPNYCRDCGQALDWSDR